VIGATAGNAIHFHLALIVGLFALTSDTAIYFLDYFLNEINHRQIGIRLA